MKIPREFAIKHPTTIRIDNDTKLLMDQDKRAKETYNQLLKRRFR